MSLACHVGAVQMIKKNMIFKKFFVFYCLILAYKLKILCKYFLSVLKQKSLIGCLKT